MKDGQVFSRFLSKSVRNALFARMLVVLNKLFDYYVTLALVTQFFGPSIWARLCLMGCNWLFILEESPRSRSDSLTKCTIESLILY